jgi:hypothetical protein
MNIDKLTYHTRRFRSGGTWPEYRGYVKVHHAGGAYTVSTGISRLSRGDALQDARTAGREIIIENFGRTA